MATEQIQSSFEQLEKSQIKLTITVSPERFREGLVAAYNRNRGHFNIPGFRKGKAPRKVIEQMYGKDVFHEEAMDHILPEAYEAALDQHELDPVYRPEIEAGDVSEADGATFIATFYVRPEVEVSDYLGITYPQGEVEPTEEEINNAIRAEQEKNSRQVSVSRPAEMGDIVTINFKGYIDDLPFEGGTGEDHDLTLGSKQFIDTFEEQLVGHVPGDDVTVSVTFPEQYHHPDYAGKPAKFEVEVIDVKAKELPEVNDEFAEDVSEFDTLEEFREDLINRIREHKEANLEKNKNAYVMKRLVEKATMEIPEAMYLARLDEMFNDFARNIEAQGMNVENYMRFTGLTKQSLMANARPQAEIDVQNLLVLSAVAVKENLSHTEEEFVKRLAEVTGQEEDAVSTMVEEMHPARKREFGNSILCEKALEFIMENAVAVEGAFPDEEPLPVDEE